MWGAKIGLCLPRRIRAASVHTRPSTLPSASMTCQARWISLAFGVYVRMPRLSVRAQPDVRPRNPERIGRPGPIDKRARVLSMRRRFGADSVFGADGVEIR